MGWNCYILYITNTVGQIYSETDKINNYGLWDEMDCKVKSLIIYNRNIVQLPQFEEISNNK